MSGYTGYIASSGYDLSLIFQGGTTNITTGFKLANGNDIATIFSAYSTGAQAPSTGLISVGGGDISTLFNWIAFSPLSIQGCCLWMDANDSSKISPATNNSAITSWTDKSPNAYVFSSPSTTTARPKFITNSQNGKSTIAFVSTSSQYFIGNGASKNFALNTSSYALFAVFQATTQSGGIYNKSLFGGVANRILLLKSNNVLNCSYTHTPTGLLPNTTNAITTYQMVSLIVNRYAGLDETYVNGTQMTTYLYTPDSSTDFTASTYETLIGAYNDSSGGANPPQAYLNGNICEIISYKNAYDMTGSTRQKIEGYLAWKWNLQSQLPSSHNYFNSSP